MNFKKKLIFILLLSIGILSTKSQNTIIGKVLNTKGENVPYVNIVSLSNTYGTTSDSIGKYILTIQSITDVFKVSSIGYKSVHISAEELTSDSIILMEIKYNKLNTISTIGNIKKFKNKAIGFRLKRSNYYMASLPGNQFSTKINCPDKFVGSYIENIQFLIAKIGNRHSPLRIRILKADTNNTPGEDIFYENIIIKNYTKETYETINIDTKSYGIKIPKEGLFISIEWLDIWHSKRSNAKSFYCTKDYIKSKQNSTTNLPSPAISMSRNKEPFSMQNYRDKRWYPMNSNCRINFSVLLRKVYD